MISDLFDNLTWKKQKINKDLVCSICRLTENEIVLFKNIDTIPRLKLLTFIKTNIKDINDNKELKDRIFNLMGNIQDLFGKNTLSELNTAFLREFEIHIKE